MALHLQGLLAQLGKAVLRARPPPPPGGHGPQSATRAGQPGPISSHLPSSRALLMGRHLHRLAARRAFPTPTASGGHRAPTFRGKAVSGALRTLNDAFALVFRGIRSSGQTSISLTWRVPIQISRNGAMATGRAMPKAPTRPLFMPHGPRSRPSVMDVGLQPARKAFHSGMGFQIFAQAHAPLALRAAADELEDDLQTYGRRYARAVRQAKVSASAYRSGQMYHRKMAMYRMQWSGAMRLAKKEAERAGQPAQVFQVKSLDAVAEGCSFGESSEYGDYFLSEPPHLEPIPVTRLYIPLCPDLQTILESEAMDLNDDHQSLSVHLRDCWVNTDTSREQRLRRILALERAFDVEPLRQYRPAQWTEQLLLRVIESELGQCHQDVFLSVDFPYCSKWEVMTMLADVLNEETARWYSMCLYETVRPLDKLSTGLGSPRSTTTGALHSPTPNVSDSDSLFDVEAEREGMGIASRISMDDWGMDVWADSTETVLLQHRSAVDLSPTMSLQYPTLHL